MMAALQGGLDVRQGIWSRAFDVPSTRRHDEHQFCTMGRLTQLCHLRCCASTASHVVEKIMLCLNVPASSHLASFIEMLNVEIGLPRTLRAMGVTEDMIPKMIMAR